MTMSSPRRFEAASHYNAAYPQCALPADPSRLRGYHAAMQGVEDDLTGESVSMTVEFLPGGAPAPGEADRLGTVVATHWGQGPVLVLAEHVSLRTAWQLIVQRWPVRLSEVRAALDMTMS
ncbi:hypothetical protein SAMN05660733_02837 [Lentzea albidocapillata]|uniref:Uncharacterized protein n=2 Tax=Lentzea TaxID=165301 RepID=A0A1W2DCQ8_9PSEU|nr:hypothetical protein SAMN05660733_02837 [Lentzea albidocapillata]